MKKTILPVVILACLLAGCGGEATAPETTVPVAETAAAEASVTVMPIPDTTMENLDNSIVAVELAEGAVTAGENGVLMRMQVCAYDQFDMVDIALLKAGDVLVMDGEEVAVTSVERNEAGSVLINGGLDAGGYDLVTDDNGIFYATGYSDVKSWRVVGEAQYALADSFLLTDSSDLDQGTVTYTAEDLLSGNPDLSTGFLAHNTTVRIENGVIVEMTRVYTP